MFDTFISLNPWKQTPGDTGITELSLRLRKSEVMGRLQNDRRYRVFELMAGFFRIPASELLAAAGPDLFFQGQSAGSHGYSLTTTIGQPARMKALLKAMTQEGSLSGPQGRNLLGSKSAALYSHGGLLTFQYKGGQVPEAFGRREGVSVRLKANPSFMESLMLQARPNNKAMAGSVASLVRQLDLEMLNHSDGTFTGSATIDHSLNMMEMVEKL